MGSTTPLDTWEMHHADGRWVATYLNVDYSVSALNPDSSTKPGRDCLTAYALLPLGGTSVALTVDECYVSAQPSWNGHLQIQWVGGDWITTQGPNETFELQLTGDGYFAIWSVGMQKYVTIVTPGAKSPEVTEVTGGCSPLAATTSDINQAARFTASGSRPLYETFLDLNGTADGLSFAGLNLTGTDLSGRDLRMCDFRNVASLDGVNFGGAYLGSANFNGCDLTSVEPLNDVSTDLTGAQFDGATLPPRAFVGAVMTGASLRGAHLNGCDLSGAHLNGADLRGADLTDCSFVGAQLEGAWLSSQDLRATAFTDPSTGATSWLAGAHLDNCNLRGVSLAGCDLSNADLSSCDLGGVSLVGCNLAGSVMPDIDLTATTFSPSFERSTDALYPTNLQGSKIRFLSLGLDWSYLDLRGATIYGLPDSDLRGLNAVAANLSGRSFSGYDLTNALFGSAQLTGCGFDNTILENVDFAAARLDGVTDDPAATFTMAYLHACKLTGGCTAYGVNFTGSTILDCSFTGATMGENDFSNAYLPFLDLSDAKLWGSTFDGACMVGVILNRAELQPARDGSKASSLVRALLQGVDFENVNLTGANLNEAVMTSEAGIVQASYHASNHKPTGAIPLSWHAKPLPGENAFDAQTVCPNGLRYDTNQGNGVAFPAMMASPYVPSAWPDPAQQTP